MGNLSKTIIISLLLAFVLVSRANAFDFGPVNAAILTGEMELEARPLFSPQRRPPPIKEQPVAAPKPEPPSIARTPEPSLADWELIGVLQAGEGGMAIVSDTLTKEVYRMEIGEMRNGWQVVKIEARQVTFRNGDISANLQFASETRDEKK